MKCAALIIIALLIPSIAIASEQIGLVVDIRVASKTLSTNPTHFKLDGVWMNKPFCATTDYWAIDTDTPAGRNFLAVVLTAQASGRRVAIWGTDQCTLRADMETVLQIGFAQ